MSASIWTVSATGVEQNGEAVPDYVGHVASMRVYNSGSNPFTEIVLIVRTSTGLKLRAAVGDTVTFSGIADQVLTGAGGTTADAPGSLGGVDLL